MTYQTIQDTELFTRSIARWASVAAAVLFGVAFLTDTTLDWAAAAGQSISILLTLAIFAGYALALTKRFELLGSVVALASILAIFLYTHATRGFTPPLSYLVVGAPALLHIVAVALRRSVLSRSAMQS